MAAFDRSPSGRSNRALFYNVDRILYVEGGRDDKGVTESFDGLFWKRIFATFRPDLKLRILPRGGKGNLIELANNILENGGSNVLVAMDRDYDELMNNLIEHDNIVYSYGYSFENDIFFPAALSDLFYSMCPVCDQIEGLQETISQLILEFCEDSWRTHAADVYGGIVGRKIIDRERAPKYLISAAYGARPKLAKPIFRQDIYKANSGNTRPRVTGEKLKRTDLPRLAVGHLYAAYCFRIMTHLHSIHSNVSKPSRDGMFSNAISSFSLFLVANDNSDIAIYYRDSLGKCH